MDVRIEEVSPVEKKLVVEVPWETVKVRLGEAYKDLAKGVQLKGFRKGKVPRSVLERMFGKRVRAEVASQLVRESFLTATSEHSLDAVAEPRIDEETLAVQTGKPFAFEAIVEVKGKVEAKDYEGMELTRRPLVVSDETVAESLEQIRREHTELRPIEGRDVTARTDVLQIAVKGNVGEHEIDRDSIMVDLEETEREPLPGLAAALTGVPIDLKDHSIELLIPEDYGDADIAGTTAKLTISISDARQKEVPALDDELAKDTGKGETLDELRAAVRKELEDQQAEQIKSELRDAAQKELVKRNQIPVASALVDRAVQYQYQRLMMMMGAPPEMASSGLDGELADKMRPQALDEVRGQLLLEAVAEAHSLEATDDDVAAYVERMATARGTQPTRLRAELDRDGRLDGIKFQLRQEKTLDFLIDKATVTEKEPEPEPAEDQAVEAAGAASTEAADAGASDRAEGESAATSDEAESK